MEIVKGATYACRAIRIGHKEVDFLSKLVIDEEGFSTLEISDVERKPYEEFKKLSTVNIVVVCDGKYITIVEGQIASCSYTVGCDINTQLVAMKYVSSILLLDYFAEPSKEIRFSAFSCEITEITELLGVYPYQIEHDDFNFSKVEYDIKGEIVSRKVGHGFSYFVSPLVKHDTDGMHVTMYGKIQYSGGKQRNFREIYEVLDGIRLFFEILSGEMIAIGNLCFEQEGCSVKVLGMYSFSKDKLNGLQSKFDSRCFLRRSIFKISDFADGIGKAITAFYKIQEECMLACEAYKQVLLDEEIKISTYNKFLKIMQVVEGFQRGKISEKDETEFNRRKNEIIGKLSEDERAFIEKYTTFNGQSFRKCMNDFTTKSIKILSGLSKTKAREASDKIINDAINDRDVYTHASKEKKPILTIDKLQAVTYCYKIFFRVQVLGRMGLSEKLIRKRLSYDRKFVSYYESVFGLQVMKEDSYSDAEEFDNQLARFHG